MLKVKTDLGCRIYVDDEFKGIARAGRINRFDIPKGEYWVRFESLTDSTIFTEKAVCIQDWDVLEVILLRPLMRRFALIPFQNNVLWGYAELFSGMEIVAPVYSSAEEFSNGYAVVRKGDRFGLVADDGTEALPCLYEEITRIWDNCFIIESDNKFALFNPSVPGNLSSFYDEWDYVWNERVYVYGECQLERQKEKGVIVVKKNGLCGIYDCLNNCELLPCEYKRIGYPTNGGRRLAIDQDSWTILTCECKPIGIIPNSSRYTGFGSSGEYAFLKSDGKWGIFDLKGNVIVPCRYDAIANSFHNGLIRVGRRQRRNDRDVMTYGFVNEKGEEIIPCIYDHALRFTNEVTFVSLYDKDSIWVSKLRNMFIDKRGNKVSDVKGSIEELFPFYKGVALYKDGSNFGIIDEKGTILTRDIGNYYNGDYEGCSNDWTSEFFVNGFHLVSQGGYIIREEPDEDGYFWGSDEEVPLTMGVIGIDGKMIVPSTTYSGFEYVECLYYDQLKISILPNSERAVICYKDREFYPNAFVDGKKSERLYGLLGRDGKEIIPCEYSHIWISIDQITLKTIAWVEKDGKYALFDSKSGEQITPFRYDHPHLFYGGKAFVGENGHLAVIDDTGSIVYSSPQSWTNQGYYKLCEVYVDSGVALLSIETLKLYSYDDKKFDSYILENGLIRFISYSKDGHSSERKWNSEMILDAQTGLEYLPETKVKLRIQKDDTSFLAQI